MELQDAYTYQLNPRAHANAECVDTNVSLQRRLDDDMNSCAFTHGTLMRACDIEERYDEYGEPESQAQAREQAMAQAREQAMVREQAQEAIPYVPPMVETPKDEGFLSIFPSSMSSAYILLIVVIVVLLIFAMMRKRR